MGSKKLTNILFYIYFGALVWIILFKMQMPFSNMGHIRSMNLIPFAGSVEVNGSIYIQEIVDNVLIFIPFGVFSSMRSLTQNPLKRLAPSFFTSLVLEILQFILAAGITDITDLLANTAGGFVGIGIFYIFQAVCKKKVNLVLNSLMLFGAIAMILLVSILILAN